MADFNTSLTNFSLDGQPCSNIRESKLKIIQSQDHTSKQWKNGLGKTLEILIEPKEADFHKDEFIWRLSSTEITHSVNLSLFPNYDIMVVPLPDGSPKGTLRTATLHHHDYEKPIPIKTLVPYTFNGDWPTSCRLANQPMNFLMFMSNRSKVQASATIETICRYQNDDLVKLDDGGTNTMLLGHVTIIHVITGQIRVVVQGRGEPVVLDASSTMVCERDQNGTTDVTLTPILKPVDPLAKSVDISTVSLDYEQGDAIVLIIQIYYHPNNQIDSGLTSPIIPCTPNEKPPLSRNNTSSIIVFDDQPMWNVPLQRRDSLEAISPASATGGNLYTKYYESAHHYKPPVFSDRYQHESNVPPAVIKDQLQVEDFPLGAISTAWINMVKQGLSEWIRIPVIVARGKEPGPVVGITAVVHGNELNGVPCIHRVISDIDVSLLKGTVVAVPCVNVPGYLSFAREFSDGRDLNRYFPGSPTGFASQVYNHSLFNKIIKQFNYMIDLHTASFGRVNSYYVRADMNDPVASVFAKLQQPQIILHNSGQDGTMRSAAAEIGIKAITVEIGNPQLFQNQYVQWSYKGVMRILAYLNMFKASISDLSGALLTVLCSRGFWIYTKTGGVLEVYPQVNSIVRKGDLIARIKNIFGNIVDEVYSPNSGVTIGRSSNPVAMAGDRILHLGVIKKEHEALAKEAKENY